MQNVLMSAQRANLAAEDLICVLQEEAEAVTMSAALLLMASDAITVPMQTKLATCHLLTALLSPREATQALFLDPTGVPFEGLRSHHDCHNHDINAEVSACMQEVASG